MGKKTLCFNCLHPNLTRHWDRTAATALFALISARYERGSVILTSNKGFAEWGDVLGDAVIATAILDRLLHHSYVVKPGLPT